MSIERDAFMRGFTDGASGSVKAKGRGKLYKIGFEHGHDVRKTAEKTFDGFVAQALPAVVRNMRSAAK